MARRRRRRALRPLPLLLAVFLVAVLLVLAYHWREHERQRRAAERPVAARVIDAARVDPRLDGRPVVARGRLTAEGELADPVFGVRARGLALLRRVEMRQWQERRAADGSASYAAVWSERPIDSSRFARAAEHANPRMPFASAVFRPARLRLGGYLLPLEAVDPLLDRAEPLPATAEALPENLAASFVLREGVLHTAADPEQPAIGDLRIRFLVLRPRDAELEAIVRGGRLEPRGPLREPVR